MTVPPRLRDATLSLVADGVERPAYDRAAVTIGVVHLGPGAFHRAHQADVFDRLLARDPRWGVCAVSLKSADARDALTPQDGLYTLVELDREVRYRIIGALKQVLVAPQSSDAVLNHLASAAVGLVTLTVTEKGYRLNGAGQLDLDHADILHDLARPAIPVSTVGWLVEGLRRRMAAGAGAISVISCDNLTDNGRKLGAAVLALAKAQGDEALVAWIADNVAFPNTMVDSITPATDDALRARTLERLGLEDAWPIQRERFTQWVIEDRLAPGAPDLAAVGVTLTSDVRSYEQAKLRLLNGPHSSLAYLGSLAGLETVGEAMADPDLAAFVERLMLDDIIPTLKAAPGQDLAGYAQAVLERFRNPEIRHRLGQIAWDGSQKLPFRLMGTITDALAAGRPLARPCAPIAGWIGFVVTKARAGEALTDPMAETLLALGREPGDPTETVARFLALETVFPPALAADPAFRAAVTEAYALIAEGRLGEVLRG
jgi:fructuronate reductase